MRIKNQYNNTWLLAIVMSFTLLLSACSSGSDSSADATADNIQVDITDGTGLVSSINYVESGADIIVLAALNQAAVTGPQTVLTLGDNINTVAMVIQYPGTSTGVHTFDSITTTGLYMGGAYFNFEDGTVNTGGSIDVTTYDAVGGIFAGTYNMDLCGFGDILGATCDATTAVNFAGSFSAQVDENVGSIGTPLSIPIDGSVQQDGMNSTFGINYYSTSGLTPAAAYSIKLGGFSAAGDMNLALTDAAGTTISCDVLAIVPDGVAEECQFTADATGIANFKISYAAGATQEQYDISLSAVSVSVPVPVPVVLAFASADLPHAGTVDTGIGYYEVTGLIAGNSYAVNITGMSADVDLYVYLSDATYGATTWDCRPWVSGTADETCNVTASGSSMWIAIDGQYTSGAGATFTLDVITAAAIVAEGSIATPVALALGTADLPHAGTVDGSMSYYEVTGLSAGITYDVSTIGMSDDADLYVYLSDATYGATTWDCRSWATGTADETCNVTASGSSMWIAIDGQYTSGGGATFTLDAQ